MNEIPEELLQRLSAYMDGQADADECTAIENELRSLPAAAQILQIYRDQGRQLKAVYRHESAAALPQRFADRVVDVAIEQACQEGCNENHPLILAGQSLCQTDVELAASRRSRTRRRVVAVLSIAASVMAVAWLGINGISRDDDSQDPTTHQIALADPGIKDGATTDGIIRDGVAPLPRDLADAVSSVESVLQTPSNDGIQTDKGMEIGTPLADSVASTTKVDSASPENPAMIAKSDLGSKATADQDQNASIGVLLVVEVKCVAEVDRDGLMREAIQWAGIEANAEHEINDGMVTAANDVVVSKDPFQMIFLNAPARQLDRLHLRLASDKRRVESVGLTLADDVKLMRLSNSINQDPTLIRDQAVAVQISGESGMAGFSDLVESLTFLPITDSEISLGGQTMTASGPDELAQILFIIR